MKAFLLGVLGAWLMATPAAVAADWVLPRTATNGFNTVREGLEMGAAGSDVVNGNIEIDRDHVILRLRLRSGQQANLMLVHPTDTTTSPRSKYFAIERGRAASKVNIDGLVGLLDASFSTDPWMTLHPASGTGATPPARP